MSEYPKLKNEADLLKIKTTDDENQNLKYKTEKHDHENIFKSLKIENENYNKNYKKFSKKESNVDYHGFSNRIWKYHN